MNVNAGNVQKAGSTHKHPTIAYILAHGHSGTTLLDYLLGEFSKAVSTGEVERISEWGASDLPEKRCTCEASVASCELWARCAAELKTQLNKPHLSNTDLWKSLPTRQPRGKGIPWFLYAGLLATGGGAFMRLFGAVDTVNDGLRATHNSLMLFDALHTVTGCSVIVDSSKLPMRMKALYLARPEKVRIIHLVRDGRAVVASYHRRQPRPQGVGFFAREWRRRTLGRMALLASVPEEHKIEIRYEDLCKAPTATLRRIGEFLGVPSELSAAAQAEGSAVKHNISGNPGRPKRMRVKDIKLDERWREEWSAQERGTFDNLGGWLNRRLGYLD